MKKFFFTLLILAFASTTFFGQTKKEPNLFIVTIDGLRWQEVFQGIDKNILALKSTKGDLKNIEKIYNSRETLMPFLWNDFSKKATIYGNRKLNSKVEVANPYWFSYPGYSELLCGYVDTKVNSNAYPPNLNTNILDFLNSTKEYKNSVVAFGAWNAFGNILNAEKAQYPTFYAFKEYKNPKSKSAELINKMNQQAHKPWGDGETLDIFTHSMAMDYITTNKPKVAYISYGEVDEWAHAENYRYYLDAIKNTDNFLKEIWTYIQTTPQYKDNTVLLITVDHGRGNLEKWSDHGSDVPGANEIWFALYDPNSKKNGEQSNTELIYQKELIPSVAKLINKDFKANHPVEKPNKTITK